MYCSPWGHKESDTTEQLHNVSPKVILGENWVVPFLLKNSIQSETSSFLPLSFSSNRPSGALAVYP